VITRNRTELQINEITGKIIGAAMEVHKGLGPGLLESTYEECLTYEISKLNLKYQRQIDLPVLYKDVKLDCGYRLDLVVEDEVLVELKSVEKLLPIHEAQLITYLKMGGYRVGLLINFNVELLKHGIRRKKNGYFPDDIERSG